MELSSLPLLPVAFSVGDIQMNEPISYTLDKLYQTWMFFPLRNKHCYYVVIDTVKLL